MPVTKRLILLFIFHGILQAKSQSAQWGPWTAWSNCNKDCGFGTAYRIRRCHAHLRGNSQISCAGDHKQFKICKIQNCTDLSSDFRHLECSKHNNVYYGKKSYTWVPYINKAYPCQLTCKSLGNGYFARFKKSVSDYVICNDQNTAMCIKGECVKTGCDGVLGSGTKTDICGICGGDGRSCKVVSGIFTRTILTDRGYNVITTIPAGACSVNITEMRRSKNYLALSTPTGYFLNGNMRLQQAGQVDGAGTTFTYSRASGLSCPGECLTAPGPLNTSLRVELIYFGYNPGILYQFTVKKDQHERRRTRITAEAKAPEERTHISFQHQQLQQHRQAQHQRTQRRHKQKRRNGKSSEITTHHQHKKTQPDLHNDAPKRKKNSKSIPHSKKQSKFLPQVISNYKKIDSDSKVAYAAPNGQLFVKNSNGTIQYQHYYHTDIHDNIGNIPVAKNNFHERRILKKKRLQHSQDPSNYAEFRSTTQYQPIAKPSGRHIISKTKDYRKGRRYPYDRSYDRGRANDYRIDGGNVLYTWRISGFTECTHSCGGGLQETRVICVKSDTQVEVIDENCPENLKPETTTVVCNKQPCEARWTSSSWSECSVTCGRGLQIRNVDCKQRIDPSLTISVDYKSCEGLRPQRRQYCQLDPCFSWKPSEWGKCSTECGFGQRYRTLACVDTEGKNVSERMCTQSKPPLVEVCDMGSCAQGWFHSKWTKQCSSSCGKGHYKRKVFCSGVDGEALEETKCSKSKKPKDKKPCRSTQPCGGQWYTGSWSKCNSSCGSDAYKFRDVLCIKQHGKHVKSVVKSVNCDPNLQPPNQKHCSKLPACKPQWYIMSWSKCSKTCDTGVKTREVKCLDEKLKPSPDCDKNKKPSRRQSCNIEPCQSQYAEFSEKPEQTTGEILLKDGMPSLKKKPAKIKCKDKEKKSWCLFARQARLCHYPHYQDLCCHTCQHIDHAP